MILRFDPGLQWALRVRMPIKFGLPSDVPLSNKNLIIRTCTVVLGVGPQGNALEGALRCEGMTQILQLRMPLG